MDTSGLNLNLYRLMFSIRRFEETVLGNFPRGVFYGTTHTCTGQEANAVGVLSCRHPGDVVFSNHRGHGHYLACGGDPRRLFAELMGRVTGVCGGRGGSQHLHWDGFYSNGVQGGIVPVATGIALAEKLKYQGAVEERPVSVVFLGDGTLGEGVVYEAFNMASLWQLPVLYVLENNRIAQTTPVEQAVAGDIGGRFRAFGIPVLELDTADVLEVNAAAGRVLDEVRSRCAPAALILNTNRFGPHSKGDDTRNPKVVAAMRRERDPLLIHGLRLDPQSRTIVETEVEAGIATAYQQALGDPYPAQEISR